MKKLLTFLSTGIFIFLLISCSDDDLAYFQKNDPEPEFSLFDILDDFPALKSAFDPIDQRQFNELLANALNDNLKEAKDVLALTDDLLVDPDHPVTDSIAHLRSTLHRVITQDEIDIDSADSRVPQKYYANGLYKLWDLISEKDMSISENIISILSKVVAYIKDTYRGEEVEEIMTDLIAYIRDNEAYLWRDNEENLFEDLARLFFQANENLWLDKNGNIITDRNRIDKNGVTDLGVGNAARGMDAILSAFNALLKDDLLRNDIYIIMREAGDLFTAEVQGNRLKDIIKDLVRNLQKYLMHGGEEYERWEEYTWPDFNPYSGYGNDNGVKTNNRERIYCDANLTNSINSLLVGLQTVCLRADRPGAAIYDRYGEKTYYLEVLIKNFLNIEEHPDTLEAGFSHIEESFYDHLRFDLAAKDRMLAKTYDADNFDPRKEPYPMSNLESMLALFFGSAITAGWATAEGKKEGFDTGELVDHASTYYGNKYFNGFLTLTNVFTGMGFNKLFGINPFDIAFTDEIKNHLYRSAFYFDESDKNDYRFNFDKDFGFLSFLSGPIVTDAGFPDGGKNDYDENGEPILNGYRAYHGLGFGNNDFAGWLLGFIVNNLMVGMGPYYNTTRVDRDGDTYTYYRPNGWIYAHVIKPDPDDAATWDYIYPAVYTDAPAPAIFLSDVDLVSGDGVFLEQDVIIKITIDGISRDITFAGGEFWDQNEVVDMINNAFEGEFKNKPVWPAGNGFQIKGENMTPPDGIIEVSDISGKGVAELIRKGDKGKRTLREYAGRENRYRERWNSCYYLVEYTPFGSQDGPIYVTPSDMSGDATGPGSLVAREMIPEHCVERECPQFTEAIERNFAWSFAEMKFSLPLTLYFSIQPEVIKDALDFLLGDLLPEWVKDSILSLLPEEVMGLPVTVAIEGNGACALLNLKFPYGSADNPVMGRWVKKGDFGDSKICGDYRFSMIFPKKLLGDNLTGPLNALLKTISSWPFNIDIGILLGMDQKADSVDDIINYVIDGVLYGNDLLGIKPILQHNMPLSPTLMLNAGSIAHIVYPKVNIKPDYSKEGNNAVYENDYDLLAGSRQGELLKDENGVVHPEWGHPGNADPEHAMWGNRNWVGLMLILALESFRDYVGYDLDKYDPNYVSSAVTHNGLGLLINDIMGAVAMPPLFYYEKDYDKNPDPGQNNRYPYNSWKPHLYGGKLKDDHPLGELYCSIDKDGDPYSSYFITPTDYIASSGVNKDTGEPLGPNTDIIFGGWALRNFYRLKDIRNIYNLLIDSEPFAPEPKRCDGLLPLLTAYDVTKYNTFSNDPNKKVNSRVITGAIRLLCDLARPEYDDPGGRGAIDEGDMSTWGLRRKLCYGIEQFVTTLKVPKSLPVAINETSNKRIIHPKWMFAEDEKGNPYPARPEDVMVEISKFPIPPEVEDWTNFDRMMDALGALLSDRGEAGGKYNIMDDVIAIMEKIFKEVDVTEENTRGLRHTIGAALTNYNKADSGWEYPDDLLHILEKELPGILEVFEGHYGNLLTLTDAMIKKNGNDESFLLYLMKNLKSEYPAKDVVEQLYEFIGIDLIKHHDSALWSDLTELLTEFVDMIDVEENPGWFENDTFHSNKAAEESDPFGALGELLSW